MVPVPIKQGDRAQVRIGQDLVLTGYVFATPISYDANQITRGMAGRSKPADLVDSAAINQPGQWSGQSMQAIVQALAGEYGIQVVSQVAETSHSRIRISAAPGSPSQRSWPSTRLVGRHGVPLGKS